MAESKQQRERKNTGARGDDSGSDGGAQDVGDLRGDGDEDEQGRGVQQEPRWGLSVQVQVGEFRFACAIGEGAQDVRWLALNAAQRYAAHVRANAKQRRCEESDLDGGALLPKGVRAGGRALEPQARLCDVIRRLQRQRLTQLSGSVSGGLGGAGRVRGAQTLQLQEKLRRAEDKVAQERELFEVELCREVALGEDGAPRHGEWLQRAFTHSAAGRAQAERLRARGAGGGGGGEAGLGGDDDEEASEVQNRLKAPGFCVHFPSAEEAAGALEADWATAVRGNAHFEAWFHTAEYAQLDRARELACKAPLLEGLEAIAQLLDSYSWQWRRAPRGRVSGTELRHLLHHAGALELPAEEPLLVKALKVAAPAMLAPARRRHGASITSPQGQREAATAGQVSFPLLGRAEFVVLLLAIAAARSKDHPLLLPDRVADLVRINLVPAAAVLKGEDKDALHRRVFGKPVVSRIFRGSRSQHAEMADVLQRVFKHYCIRAASLRAEPTMQLRELRLFMQDAMPQQSLRGLRGAARRGNTAGRRAAREGKESGDGGDRGGDRQDDDDDDEDDEAGDGLGSNKKAALLAMQVVCKSIFERCQLVVGNGIAPLPEIVFAEFVQALLLALYDAEAEIDTWDSKHGAERLLSVVDHLAAHEVD